MFIHIYGFLDFLSLCSSILCIVQSEMEDETAKATENYINLECGSPSFQFKYGNMEIRIRIPYLAMAYEDNLKY